MQMILLSHSEEISPSVKTLSLAPTFPSDENHPLAQIFLLDENHPSVKTFPLVETLPLDLKRIQTTLPSPSNGHWVQATAYFTLMAINIISEWGTTLRP